MGAETDIKTTCEPLRFDIGGMHCAACSSRIERVLGRMPGIAKVSVNLASASAEVWPEKQDEANLEHDIMARVAKLGFTATPTRDEDSARQYEENRKKAEAEKKERLARLWPMVIFSVPLLFVSMGHMAGIPMPAWLEPHAEPKNFILVQLLLTAPVIWLGRHFYVDGFGALIRRSPNMDSLVAVGTGAAFLYSLVNSILAFMGYDPVQKAMNLYYESSAVLLTMIEFGKFLEFTAKRKASDAIGALMSLTPQTALRIVGDSSQPEEIPVSAVRKGDRLLVRPGSRIPVDGTVLEGQSAVDLSLLTGESIPVPVSVGDALVAGSVNFEGSMIMATTAVGQDTRLARIIRLVREAQGSKAPIARLADKVSFYFVPAVMLLAVLSALDWLIFSNEPFTTALTVFVAVLVMACPCAMGLATPMSIMMGTARGAQMGVLIKNGVALEQASQIKTICLDKTGTITNGRPELTNIILLNEQKLLQFGIDKNDLLSMAASLEGRSEHPLALAIIDAARKNNCPDLAVENVKIAPGLGLSGDIKFGERLLTLAIGNEAFIGEDAVQSLEGCSQKLAELAADGQTPLILSLQAGENETFLAGIFALADELRPETRDVVAKLHKMGVHIVMLTGDNARTAAAIARKAGIEDVHAQLLPAQKADFIRQLQEQGQIVGMVGDGLNDAPALALADVGMAIGSGVDVSAEAGDIVLMRGGMSSVLAALGLSRATMRNIRQNLGWAFGYNILGLPIAAGLLHVFGGPMLSPMLAGTAMALSSFSVVTNALRLRWYNAK